MDFFAIDPPSRKLVEDLQGVGAGLFEHSRRLEGDIRTFINVFENWGRRDVSKELPRVEQTKDTLNMAYEHSIGKIDQEAAAINLSVTESIAVLKLQFFKRSEHLDRRQAEAASTEEMLAETRQRIAQQVADAKAQADGRHKQVVDALRQEHATLAAAEAAAFESQAAQQ